MDKQEIIDYWLTSAKNNVKAAKDMFASKHYDWALFIWQLVLEKTLKAIIVSQGRTPPPVHDLVRLAKIAKLALNTQQTKQLTEISKFNLDARYDIYKFGFQQKATKTYATTWLAICKQYYLWLKKQL